MELRGLGRTGVRVSRFGLGTMVLGAWGNTDHDDCVRLINRALVRDGKIGAWGTSTFPAAELVEACWAADRRGVAAPHSEQPLYSIMCRGIEAEVLPACRRHGIGVIVWSPLSGGWLTGKYQRSAPPPPGSRAATNPDHFDAENEAKYVVVDQLGVVAEQAGLTMTQLALAWAVEHPAVTAALIGPRTNDQLDDLLTAATITLDADVLDAIDEIVAPGVDVNPADAGWTSPGLERSHRRRSAQ